VVALLERLMAQSTAKDTIERAIAAGRVHHALLFDGPDGVGKELAAFGLAQALVCERRRPTEARACGECAACSKAEPRAETGRPTHPDVIVIERGAYDPAMIGRRTQETQDISIDQIRTLVLARAAFAPHEGRARVYVVRRADELSTPAANALLKTLEEPTRNSYFILVTSRPGSLLSTVRSRTQRVRFGYLPDDVVATIGERSGMEKEHARSLAVLAGGSASALLALNDPAAAQARDAFVERAMGAVDAPHIGPGMDLAAEAKQTKDGLEERLLALAAHLASKGRSAGPDALRTAKQYRCVVRALSDLDRNASTQLAIESMVLRMRSA